MSRELRAQVDGQQEATTDEVSGVHRVREFAPKARRPRSPFEVPWADLFETFPSESSRLSISYGMALAALRQRVTPARLNRLALRYMQTSEKDPLRARRCQRFLYELYRVYRRSGLRYPWWSEGA